MCHFFCFVNPILGPKCISLIHAPCLFNSCSLNLIFFESLHVLLPWSDIFHHILSLSAYFLCFARILTQDRLYKRHELSIFQICLFHFKADHFFCIKGGGEEGGALLKNTTIMGLKTQRGRVVTVHIGGNRKRS